VLTIENCEPAFTGTIGDVSVLEGSYNSSLDLTQYFSDLFNNDTLTYTVNGNVTNLNFNDFASFGLVNISPSENYVGTNVINFTANDGKGGSKTSNNLIVTVTNQNDAPTIIVDNQEFNENETKVFYITASDIDPTNDVLTIGTNASLGTFTQINNTYAKLNWTPTNSDVGTYYVLFNVSDGLGGTANKTVVLTVSNVNNAPVLDAIINIDTYQGNATKFQLHGSDVDSGAVLNYSCNVTAMDVVKVNDSLANVTWTPTNSDVGNKSVKCTVTDNAGAFDYKIFNINVININDAPSITNLPASKTGVVGQSFVYDVNAIDVDGDNSTFTSNSTIFTINSTSGVIDFTPAVKGTYSINVTADDGNGGIDSEILSLTIYDTLSIANTQVSVDNGAYTALGYGETLSSTVSQGQSLKLQADFKNWLDTNNMNLVLINATLKDGSFSKSKIESIIPLNKTKQVTKVMDLGIIPANAENGNYTLQIKAVGYYGSENVTADWNAFVSVESDSNQIFIIEPTVVIPSSIQCVRDIIVNATVKNMAVNLDQNITVTVLQSSLGINQQSESQVVNRGQNGEFTLPVSIAFDKPAGNYSITIKATSDYGGFSQITKNLEVKACQLTFDPATNPTISNSANQIFTISNSGIDLTIAKVEWEKNGVSVGTNSTSYPYVAEIQTGRLTHTIYAKVTDNLGNIFEKTWTLTTTSYPIADTMAVSPTLSSLNETQLQNVSSLTLSKSGYGTIQFLEPVDLSGIVLLDGHVNFSGGIIAVDTSGSLYGQLNHPARIIMTGLTYNEVPKIYYSSGFTTNPSSITTNCTNTFCFLQQYTAPPTTNGEVIFNVTHLSSYRVGTTAIVPPTNAAVANAGSDQTVAVNTLVTLDGSGSTGDSPIIYSWTAPSGVTLSSTTAQKPTFTPTSTGTYTFVLTATNAYGSSTDSVTINVQQSTTASGNLTITDLNIKVGGKSSNDLSNGDTISRDAKPGDTLKFDVEATNMFSTDTEIRDIEISVTIKDIDDGDDLDDDMDIDDLDDGDDDSAVFEFTVPTLVDEDTYDVIIKAKGKDENGKTQEDVWELKLDVEKDKHEILVDRADLSPQTLTCSRNANIDVKLVNIGREDEDDVSVEIINDALGINLKQTGIDLEEGSDDDSVYEQTFRISIADDAEAGTYPILVKSYYDGKSSGQETVDLVVDDCVNIYTPVETEPEIEVVTTTPTTTPVKTTTTISFMDESVYLTLLAVLFVVLLGGVVFLVGAAVIILKKRR
ncbi:MAG: PKD domain-containing protein, partial [Nanoarchaeota archaeon]|nr:PKD domain-containing protein [Nanoarchaeota archaeon]